MLFLYGCRIQLKQMQKNLKTLALSFLGMVATTIVLSPNPALANLNEDSARYGEPEVQKVIPDSIQNNLATLNIENDSSIIEKTQDKSKLNLEYTETAPENIEVVPEMPKIKRLVCRGCNSNEIRVLDFFQDQGITDKNALATLMGNIRQESMFIPNICEGGARTSYRGCTRGGYGLIQFTSIDRYNGLGHFSYRSGGDPSSLDTQLEYIITEPQWKRIENMLKTPGKPIEYYMRLAYSWLGWGIKGARASYSYDYVNSFELAES